MTDNISNSISAINKWAQIEKEKPHSGILRLDKKTNQIQFVTYADLKFIDKVKLFFGIGVTKNLKAIVDSFGRDNWQGLERKSITLLDSKINDWNNHKFLNIFRGTVRAEEIHTIAAGLEDIDARINTAFTNQGLDKSKLKPDNFKLVFENKTVTHIKVKKLGEGGQKIVTLLYDISKKLFEALATPLPYTEKLRAEGIQTIKEERAISEKLKKEGIKGVVEYHEIKTIDGEVGVLIEFCAGGDMGKFWFDKDDNLIKPNTRPAKELKEIYKKVHSFVSTLDQMHKKGYIHRDIKPDNIFLTGKGQTRIGDLGMVVHEKEKREEQCGTTMYMAPELNRKIPATTALDCWSLGVMLLQLETGHNVSRDGVDKTEGFNNIKDKGLKNLISGLLNKDPQKRLTAADALPVLKRLSQ